jgi:predicted ATP-dependent endonuclease of OLD family
MKISKIKVQNFRSIKSADFDCKDFNVFVGQNNCGKTNLFEAVEWFYIGTTKTTSLKDIAYGRDITNEIIVEIEFIGAQDGISKMRNEGNGIKMSTVLNGSDSILVKRSSADNKRKIIISGKEIEKLPTGFDTAFNDFLPRFEYINTKQYFDSVAKYGKTTPIGIMLSGVLTTILEKNTQYHEFQKKFQDLFESDTSEIKIEFNNLGNKVKLHLEKQFPDTTKVKFEVTPPVFDELLKNFETTVDDGVETTASDKGDGMQRALMLAIIQAYSDFRKQNDDIGKSFLFFIDEAELHLHPTAQRNLKNVLLDLSSTIDQVFINTHSSVLVADDHANQQIFKVEKHNKETSICCVGEADKPYVIYELLGGSPSDLLLPRNFLIVEGPSEVEFLLLVVKRLYPDKTQIQIIPAEGDTSQAERTINSIEKVFSPLNKSLYKEKIMILCDKPSAEREGGVKDFLQRFKDLQQNHQIVFLPNGSLEEYYPNHLDWNRTSEEVSRMSGKQKRQLGKRVGKEITQDQFETEMKVIFNALESAWSNAF